MVRIIGIQIPDNKRVFVGLTYIYGIGKSRALRILSDLKIDPMKKSGELTSKELEDIRSYIEKNFKVEGRLREEIMFNIRRLKEIKAWRGLRHLKGLPVHGQQTRTNTRTVRGNVRRTVATARKPPPAPK